VAVTPSPAGDGPAPRARREAIEDDRQADREASAAGLLADLKVARADPQAEVIEPRMARAEAGRDAARAVAIADVEAAKRVAETGTGALRELIEELRRALDHQRRPWRRLG
jgi:hypothetical protein